MGLENEEGVTDFTLAGGLPKAASSAQFDIEVQQGDTIYKMSRVLGIPVEKLVEANGGKEEVFANTTIRLPDNIISDISNAKSEVQSPLLSDRAANALKLYPQLGGMLSKAASVDPEVTDEALERQYKQKAREKEMAAIAADRVVTPEVEEVQEQEPAVVQTEAALSKAATFEADGFEYTLAAEGDYHHVDGGGVLTMSYGIVPDKNSISLNGDLINPKTGHTFKAGSDLSKIDFSKATKTVRGVVIKRVDYTTDKEFANAVYTTMATKTKGNLESNKGFKSKWADLPREAKIALVDLDFNTGVGKENPIKVKEMGGSHWADTGLMATEMVKPLEDRSTANLIKFTQNFQDNGVSPRGLLRRRLKAYNLVAKVEDKAVYIKQHKKEVADGVYKDMHRHDVFRADGTIIVSWYKEKSPGTKADESVQRVVDGEVFNELPVSPKPKQAALDLTDWAGAIV